MQLNIRLTVLFSVFCYCATAQDPQFSQYFSSPLSLNPAFTGYYDGTHRIASNFRNQWVGAGDPFTTASVSFDTRVMREKLKREMRLYSGALQDSVSLPTSSMPTFCLLPLALMATQKIL